MINSVPNHRPVPMCRCLAWKGLLCRAELRKALQRQLWDREAWGQGLEPLQHMWGVKQWPGLSAGQVQGCEDAGATAASKSHGMHAEHRVPGVHGDRGWSLCGK